MIDLSEFKPYPEYQKYLVSKDGRVFSTKTHKLVGSLHNDGYKIVTVDSKNNIRKKVHRMVMETFGPDIPKDMPNPVIDHIDDNITNNHIDNLRWLSAEDNVARGLHKRVGFNHGRNVLTKEQVLEIRKLYNTNLYTYVQLSEKFPVSATHIRRICRYELFQDIIP